MFFRLMNRNLKLILMLKNFNPRRRVFPAFLAVILLLAVSVVAFTQQTEETVNAIKFFNQGQDAHEKGDFIAALKYYQEALEMAPEFPEAEFQMGNALLSAGKKDEAETAFKRAIGLRADWSLPMASLGSLLIDKEKFGEAEKILTKAIELDAQNSPAYVALTELRIRTKASPAVLRNLLDKLKFLTSKANPTAAVWAARGAIEKTLGEKASAKTSVLQALSIDKNNQFALLERAEIAFSEADAATVSATVKFLTQMYPDSKNVKLLQARHFADTGKTVEAVKILDSISNPSADVLLLRDSISDNINLNVAELEKRLEKQEKNLVILSRLCALLRIDNPAKALDYCKRAWEIEPANATHAVGYGAALVQDKKYADAANIFRKLLQYIPDNFTARANLATALFQLKRFAEAKVEYQWLTEKQPTLPIAYYFLAISHDNLEEYMDAMANYQQFLKLADSGASRLEIEKVNLRLPGLQRLIKQGKGKKNK